MPRKKIALAKKELVKTERVNFHIGEFKNSKIYLTRSKIPDYASKDDIHIVNALFTNVFSCVETLELSQRQNIICWGAEGLVVIEGRNQYISKSVAKEVSLALHLDLPVWVLRGFKMENVIAVIREWQGKKEDEDKWASILIEGQDIPQSMEFTTMSLASAPFRPIETLANNLND